MVWNTLFNIFLEIVIAVALHGMGSEAVINGVLLSDLRFVDDIREGKRAVVRALDTDVAEVSTKMGMCINTAKTETQVQGRIKASAGPGTVSKMRAPESF